MYEERAPHPDGLRKFLESAPPLGLCAVCERVVQRPKTRSGTQASRVPRFCWRSECRAVYFRLWARDAQRPDARRKEL
jgi:hypothetical protein